MCLKLLRPNAQTAASNLLCYLAIGSSQFSTDIPTFSTPQHHTQHHKHMPQRRRVVDSCSSSCASSSSDEDDAPPQLPMVNYQAAGLAFGLGHRYGTTHCTCMHAGATTPLNFMLPQRHHRSLRHAALLELQEVFNQNLYSSADKKVQQAIYEDLLLAAQQRDRCVWRPWWVWLEEEGAASSVCLSRSGTQTPAHPHVVLLLCPSTLLPPPLLTPSPHNNNSRTHIRQAINVLLSAARRVLPQKQRQQLTQLEKQAAVAASRAARRKEGAPLCDGDSDVGSEEEEGSSSQVVFSDVPLQVLGVILQALDPLSLAAAACVCR